MANQPPSEEKMHYDSLISLFKYVLGLASIIVVIAAFFIKSSIQDIKKDIQEDVAKLKPDIEKIGKDADKTLADTKESSKLSLDYTKTLSEMQVKLLALQTADAAKLEVKNKVEEAFKNNNLQTLIDATARKEVNDKLKEVVKEETDKTRDVFNYLSQIQIAFEQVGRGSRYHLDFLDSLSNYAENNMIKLFTKDLIIQKGKDYENTYIKNIGNSKNSFFYKPISFFTDSDGEDSLDTSRIKITSRFNLVQNASNEEIIKNIVRECKKEQNLIDLTIMYWHLRKLTGIRFTTFDSKPVIDWYNLKYKK